MLIDESLTWENHIDALSKNIASGIGAINHCLTPNALHDVYYGLVHWHFDYCSMVWGNCGKPLRDKLQRLQNRAVRVLANSNYHADASTLLNDLGWQNIETRQIQKAVMVYKSLNYVASDYISSRFRYTRSNLINSYNLRDSENKLAVLLPRTNYYRNSFCYSGAVLWNNLPTDVRQAKSLTGFRKPLTSSSNSAFMENRLQFYKLILLIYLFQHLSL